MTTTTLPSPLTVSVKGSKRESEGKVFLEGFCVFRSDDVIGIDNGVRDSVVTETQGVAHLNQLTGSSAIALIIGGGGGVEVLNDLAQIIWHQRPVECRGT